MHTHWVYATPKGLPLVILIALPLENKNPTVTPLISLFLRTPEQVLCSAEKKNPSQHVMDFLL